ncbi:MAG: TonB family protein [Bacteroidota bacterium]
MNYNKQHALRNSYILFFQIGLILALLLVIFVVKSTIKDTPPNVEVMDTSFVPLSNPAPIIKRENPPPPLKPAVLLEQPDNSPIDDDPIDFGSFEDAVPINSLPPRPDKNEDDEPVAPHMVEQYPEIIGGLKALYKHITYPKMAQELNIEGKVAVQFIINKQGGVEELEIIRSLGHGLDEAVLDALRKVRFTPGVQNGRLVRVKMIQSVNFRLN